MDHQEYMNWANQQPIELFPGVVLPISMITAPITEEEMDFLNAKMAEFAPLNAQIIDEPRWYLSGVHRSRIDLKGIASESYQCSDGYWRILEGDQLESARRRTTNLQAPTRAAIPRPAALQTPVHQTAALQTPVHQTAALQTPVVRATAHDAPVANGQFGNAFSQTAHFQ
ncbi:uncharacterized protein TrAtP1_012591 [Trichoderma atroviride]|uniref:uncharacterized protein n=1 Tax=Hypocrea atroviridis TaxID=63577 RepID=UPI00331A890D|nr:hypothetical protein TrAtP1_012591 [Trichoderma atroviride]